MLGVWIGATAANFIYQFFASGDWWTATDRSVFQGVALVAVYISRRFAKE